VLAEIGAGDVPQIVVYNKIDKLVDAADDAGNGALRAAVPLEPPFDTIDARVPRVRVSAVTGAGLDSLREAITQALRRERVHRWLKVPDSAGRLRARLFEAGLVASERAAEHGWEIEIDAPRMLLEPLFGLPGGEGEWLEGELGARTEA